MKLHVIDNHVELWIRTLVSTSLTLMKHLRKCVNFRSRIFFKGNIGTGINYLLE